MQTMKQKLGLCICLFTLLALGACGGNHDAERPQHLQGDGTEEGTQAVQNTEMADRNQNTQPSEDQFDSSTAAESGYVFIDQNVIIAPDVLMAEIVEALGDAQSYYEAASCAFDGLDKIYGYGSYEIDTYPDEDGDRINVIILKDDLVSTVEGVIIGDPIEKVIETYGPCEAENGELVYPKGGMKLTFIVRDGIVASIEYRSTVLD